MKSRHWLFLSAALLVCVIAVLPIWIGPANEIVGAGPDVVSTLWGMWWFQQSGAAIFGGTHSTLANYPEGVIGVVLAPSAAVLWALLEPLLGKILALRFVASAQIWGLIIGVIAVCAQLTRNIWAAIFGGISLCVGRYLYFSIGEASLVAIAAIPLIWGLLFVLKLESSPKPSYGVFLFGCIVWMALENPYLAPILPLVLIVVGLFAPKSRYWMFGISALGLLGLWGIASLFSAAANPDYPREVAGQWVELFGRHWEIIDLPWARLRWWTVAWPESINWTIGVDDARQASGGRYLGLTVVALGLFGLVKTRLWRWLILAVLAYWLSLGSVHFGLSGLFLFVNGLMDALARPLTQPTRFLIVVQIALSVGVASLAKDLIDGPKPYWVGLLVILFVDAFVGGGLQMRLPTMPLPEVGCELAGPTLVWPYDAQDGAQSTSQLLQMSHHQPSPHTAIASWALGGDRVLNSLRAAGFRMDSSRLNLNQIKRLGYRWIIVEGDVPAWARSVSLSACGERQVLDLGD